MKFNVGDKVRFVKSIIYHNKAVELGEIYTVQEVYNRSYRIENGEWFNEEELVLANYTYEDLKKSPIGTKIIFENGEVLVKYDYFWYSDDSYLRNSSDLRELKDRQLGKIIKIKEPTYQTVYEAKVEILDDVEKRYLRGVIRPFEVKYIEKGATRYAEFIYIKLKKEHISLPDFEPNTMYKGMEINKKYTLEELGL